jgi:hypothetical protein
MKKIIPVLSLLLFQGSVLFSQSGIITTIAGNGVQGYSGDGGPATDAELNLPSGISFDGYGNYYIGDRSNYVIRKVDIFGNITTIAGNHAYGPGYTGDGGPATAAELSDPWGITSDSLGNLYISTDGSGSLRKVDASTGIITTFAGIRITGYSGDGGPATAAEISAIGLSAIDSKGNLIFPDFGNNVIRKIDTSGIITTIIGNHSYGAGYSGDGGPATAAELDGIEGVGIDKIGNIYIPDCFNYVIRKVDTSGIITTIIGNHHRGFSGDGGPATAAELDEPCNVWVDAYNNIYIADELNNEVRMVNSSGIITTVAGNHITGFSGDGGPSTAAELDLLTTGAFDKFGNLFIADEYNNRIRKVTSVTTGISPLSTFNPQLLIYPNPAQNVIYVQVQGGAEAEVLELYSITGQKIQTSSHPADIAGRISSYAINSSALSDGVYFLKVQLQDGGTIVKKVEIVK